jgi:hypothetical protein
VDEPRSALENASKILHHGFTVHVSNTDLTTELVRANSRTQNTFC